MFIFGFDALSKIDSRYTKNGVGFEREHTLNKTSSKPDMQIGKTSISSKSLSFPVEPQLSIGSRANQIILQNDIERQEQKKSLDETFVTNSAQEPVSQET